MSDKMINNRRMLAFLCCAAYFASYMTRINYAAVRLAIADELVLTNPELVMELGLAISAVSVSYGFGQFLSGLLGDRLSPVSLVCMGLGGAMLCNLLVPTFYPNVYLMAVAWGVYAAEQMDKKESFAIMGLFDISQRSAAIKDYLSMTMPYKLWENMTEGLDKSCLTTHSWKSIEKRL